MKAKKKKKVGGEQEHNSLVSIARLLFSSFYLHFSTTGFTILPFFFFNRTSGIYPFSISSPLPLLLALLVNERAVYNGYRTDGSCVCCIWYILERVIF